MLAIRAALEAYESGDVPGAIAMLLGALEDGPAERPHRCRYCPASFEWPGLRERHELSAHPEALAA